MSIHKTNCLFYCSATLRTVCTLNYKKYAGPVLKYYAAIRLEPCNPNSNPILGILN